MKIFRYFIDSIREGRNIKWLGLKDSAKLLFLVLVFGILIGFFLGAIDFGISSLIQSI